MAKQTQKKEVSKPTLIKKVRASFPALIKPKAFEEGQEPKYEVTLLISKKRDIAPIKDAINKAKIAKFGPDKEAWPKLKYPTPLMDGDEKGDTAGYAGHYYIKATSKSKPIIVDLEKQEIAASEIYPGCYINALVNFSAYEYGKNGKVISRGVACYLNAVQLNNDIPGEKFGMTVDVDAFDDEDESEDLDSDESEDEAPKKKPAKKKPSLDDEDESEDEDFSDED